VGIEESVAIVDSVTRFGKISPLQQKLRNLWQYFKGLFGIWQSCEPTLGQFVFFWANFNCCKCPNLEKQSGHLVTLIVGGN